MPASGGSREALDETFHPVVVRALPVDSLAVGTSVKLIEVLRCLRQKAMLDGLLLESHGVRHCSACIGERERFLGLDRTRADTSTNCCGWLSRSHIIAVPDFIALQQPTIPGQQNAVFISKTDELLLHPGNRFDRECRTLTSEDTLRAGPNAHRRQNASRRSPGAANAQAGQCRWLETWEKH